MSKAADSVLDLTIGDNVFVSKSIMVERLANGITVVRYFSLHRNSRAWNIECSVQLSDWNRRTVASAITEAKQRIAEEKKYTKGIHGMTFYA
ncbi:MAG: hypothetical protein ACTIJH_07510 [Moraxellaceae bacterium]